MAASSLRMSKQTLENTTMHVYRVRGSKTTTTMSIEVELQPQNMRVDKAYVKEVGPDNWSLEVVIGTLDVTLKLFTKASLAGTSHDVNCSVQYDDAVRSEWVVAQKTSRDTHLITLPPKIICHPENAFLMSGRGLICILEVVSINALMIIPHGGARLFEEGQLPSLMFYVPRNMLTDESDEERLLKCLTVKNARKLFTDFNLRGLGKSVVPVHKSVLAARSGLFRDLLRENAEMEVADVDYPENVIEEAIYFPYHS